MIRYAILALLIASPAFAQQPTPGQTACQLLYNRELQSHFNDLSSSLAQQDQIATLKGLLQKAADVADEKEKKIKDLQAELDHLKAPQQDGNG